MTVWLISSIYQVRIKNITQYFMLLSSIRPHNMLHLGLQITIALKSWLAPVNLQGLLTGTH